MTPEDSGISTHRCCVLGVLVSNLLHDWVAHEVRGLVAPVLLGCTVWSSQRRVGSQVDFLHVQYVHQQLLIATSTGTASKRRPPAGHAALAADVNTP